jgi:hypothetical protein
VKKVALTTRGEKSGRLALLISLGLRCFDLGLDLPARVYVLLDHAFTNIFYGKMQLWTRIAMII